MKKSQEINFDDQFDMENLFNSYKKTLENILDEKKIEEEIERIKFFLEWLEENFGFEFLNYFKNYRLDLNEDFQRFLETKLESSSNMLRAKKVQENFTLNILNDTFPEVEEREQFLMYDCYARNKNSGLKNILIKFYFDLEEYQMRSNSRNLDLFVLESNGTNFELDSKSLLRTDSYIMSDSLCENLEENKIKTSLNYKKNFQNDYNKQIFKSSSEDSLNVSSDSLEKINDKIEKITMFELTSNTNKSFELNQVSNLAKIWIEAKSIGEERCLL